MMLRVLLVAGLTMATLATSEARGFRLPFRGWSHAHAAGEPHMSPTSAGLAAASLSRAGAKILAPSPKATASSGSGQGSAAAGPSRISPPAAPSPAAEPPRRFADAAHWCDGGTLVGTGKGFCVISRAAD